MTLNFFFKGQKTAFGRTAEASGWFVENQGFCAGPIQHRVLAVHLRDGTRPPADWRKNL